MSSPSILHHVIQWANGQDDVRVALLVGSHAGDGETDDLSDYDVCLFVRNQHRYVGDHGWLAAMGKVWLCEKNTAMGECGVSPVHYRLTVYEPGTRVDFSIYSLPMLEQIVTADPAPGPNLYTLGYEVLVDKDGRTNGMAPPSAGPLLHEPPTEERFRQVVEDFWHEAHNVAKYLARGDLWTAKFRDGLAKRSLLQMLQWRAHTRHGWRYDTGHLGTRMSRWVEPEVWRSLHDLFAHFDAEDSRRALRATIALFRATARETATELGYEYLEHEDAHMGDLIQQMISQRG